MSRGITLMAVVCVLGVILGCAEKSFEDMTVPEVVEALKDDNRETRLLAAMALSFMEPPIKEVVPVLIEFLENGDDGERTFSVVTLGQMGSDAGDALPSIIEALNDESSVVREKAAYALHRIDPENYPEPGEE